VLKSNFLLRLEKLAQETGRMPAVRGRKLRRAPVDFADLGAAVLSPYRDERGFVRLAGTSERR
jgi:hypothetical protein